MIKVRTAEPLNGYRLALKFSDGTNGIADLSHHIKRKPFLTLQKESVFRHVIVEHGAVEWPDGDVGIATEALYALVHDLPKPATREQARANEREVSLRELRKIAGRTQIEVAEAMEIDQGQLSRFERQEDMRLSTLRRYVAAIGGDLEVVAVLGDKRVAIRGI